MGDVVCVVVSIGVGGVVLVVIVVCIEWVGDVGIRVVGVCILVGCGIVLVIDIYV